MDESPATVDAAVETSLAASLFNGVWTLLENPGRTADDDLLMVHMAHASRYHWGRVGTAVNIVRGEWQCSRVYATLRRGEPALFHAQGALETCEANGIGGFDLAFLLRGACSRTRSYWRHRRGSAMATARAGRCE